MPGCSGEPVVTNARAYYTTRAAAGASAPGIPHALFFGADRSCTTRADRAAGWRTPLRQRPSSRRRDGAGSQSTYPHHILHKLQADTSIAWPPPPPLVYTHSIFRPPHHTPPYPHTYTTQYV